MKPLKKNSIAKRHSQLKLRVNKELDKYSSQILFPEKLTKMNKLLKGVKLP